MGDGCGHPCKGFQGFSPPLAAFLPTSSKTVACPFTLHFRGFSAPPLMKLLLGKDILGGSLRPVASAQSIHLVIWLHKGHQHSVAFKTTSSKQSHRPGSQHLPGAAGNRNKAEIQGPHRVKPSVRPSLVLTYSWSGSLAGLE